MPTPRLSGLKDTLAAVFGLINVAAVTAAAPGGVHHAQAPANEIRDYVLLQAPAALPWDAMQSPGEQVSFSVAAVTLADDYGRALALVALVVEQLDRARPAIADHLCVALQWRATEVFTEPELINGVTTWRAVATFSALVDQA